MNIELLQLKLNNAIKALNIANIELRKIVEIIEAGNRKIDKRLSNQTVVKWNNNVVKFNIHSYRGYDK